MKGKITLLGTGTCQIQSHRMASSVLIELGNLKVIYDIGRGICQRLNQLGFKQKDIKHIVLSHFHPDHCSDLIPFLHAASWSKIDPRKTQLNIYSPIGFKNRYIKLLKIFTPGKLVNDNYKVKIHKISQHKFSIGKYKFIFSKLPPINNHGLKFTFNHKTYAITGDSDFHQQEIDFIKNTDLAIIDSGHITDKDIIDLSVETQAKKIVCYHQYRELDEKKLNSQAKKQDYQGKIIVGQDLMSFNI